MSSYIVVGISGKLGNFLADILRITLTLLRSLQAIEINILSAVTLINTITASVQRQRETSSGKFIRLFAKAKTLPNKICTEITVHRITGRQSNIFNIRTIKDYCRLSIFISFTDYLINETSFRFLSTQLHRIGQFQMLLPHNFSDQDIEKVLQGAEVFKEDLH